MTSESKARSTYICVKSVADTLAAIAVLIVVSPILLLAAIAIKVSSPGPVFFRQDRPGKHEKVFRLYKFRTMAVAPDEGEDGLSDAERMTPVGEMLRKTSIDELPQLINIIKQEMSFIGPRPLLVRYLPFYTETERLRHTVRPGISGWAQVNGRNTLNWEEKFKYDVEYVEKISLAFDLKILLLTLKKLFYRSEVITAGTTHSTMALDEERRHFTTAGDLLDRSRVNP